jgi:hypothetical protein
MSFTLVFCCEINENGEKLSKIDQDFIADLGISITDLSEVLKKTRQAISKGVSGSNTYLGVLEISKVLDHFSNKDDLLFSVAKQKVCSHYPDLAEHVLTVFQDGTPAFSDEHEGEFIFVCGDVDHFTTDLSRCENQIKSLILNLKMTNGQLNFITTKSERRKIKPFLEMNSNGEVVQYVACDQKMLAIFPTVLLRRTFAGEYSLYGCKSTGFTPLARSEANRMRQIIALFGQPNASGSDLTRNHEL